MNHRVRNRLHPLAWGLLLSALAATQLACGDKEKNEDEDDDGESLGGAQGANPSLEDDDDEDDDAPLGEGGRPGLVGGSDLSPVYFSDEGQLDLLFVIDNSISMADKQDLLAKAVPQMLERLINPDCVDDSSGEKSANLGSCPSGSTQEARTFDDMHVGVITSSLGSHGSDSCLEDDQEYDNDDKGRLVPSVRSGPFASGDVDFLAWTGSSDKEQRAQLISHFEEHVNAVGELGCGFEAPLESWYRFLVDPQPPESIFYDPATGRAGSFIGVVDETVLAQREAFLRPNSWVAIVLLTDEDDCSIFDGGSYYNNASFGYLIGKQRKWDSEGEPTAESYQLPIATQMCETNANDKCCFSCLQRKSAPEGCEEQAAICGDSEEPPATFAPHLDRPAVRCFDGERRFGVELLYPTERYVDALTEPKIVDGRDGRITDNPLLRGVGKNAGVSRNPDKVFFAGIVGVPWQDIATDKSLEEDSETLEYLTPRQMGEKSVSVDGVMVDRWQVILGDPGRPISSHYCTDNEVDDPACGRADVPPLDPFMIQSIDERPAGLINPITGDKIVRATSNDPRANAINGHETDFELITNVYEDGLPQRNELQYACTFELDSPKNDCSADAPDCDCGLEPSNNRSICQSPAGGPASTTQYFAKAYPSSRILQVLRDLGSNSILGSICPKFPTGDQTNLSYGYNPVLQQLVDRVHAWQSGGCFEEELEVDREGLLVCDLVEVKDQNLGELNCDSSGREEVDEELRETVLAHLKQSGDCTGQGCEELEICALRQLEGPARDECLLEGVDTSGLEEGFCYIDPAKSIKDSEGRLQYVAGGGKDGTNKIVSNCEKGKQRMLRFTGLDTPAEGTHAYVICEGGFIGK